MLRAARRVKPRAPIGTRGLPARSLIRSLIRPRPAPFGPHHRERVALVTDVAGPYRTVTCRLGKRVARACGIPEIEASPRHATIRLKGDR
jgi:hypothetical protein